MNAATEGRDPWLDAERGRLLVEESREIVVVLDESDTVIAASRRARESLPGLMEGTTIPRHLLEAESREPITSVTYELAGRRERIVYLGRPGEPAGYEELRAGFTAAVSHELRTPLARLLALLETALLPDENALALIEQARDEVEHIRELIDEILFLSELETGQSAVARGATNVLALMQQVVAEHEDSAARAGVVLRAEGDEAIELGLRPRMLRVLCSNLVENAIRYAGPGSRFTLSVRRQNGSVVLSGSDNGVGVLQRDIPRLFERFYRADRARASSGTGLGLAIVKHVVTAAGGLVEAVGARGRGLEIRCSFPEGGR